MSGPRPTSKAPPQPMRKVNPSSCHGPSSPSQAVRARPQLIRNMKSCAPSITVRRGKPSATAPATSDSSITGSVVDVCTSATMSAVTAMEVIAQAAPTAWIRPPRLDTMLANQRLRNTGIRMGARVELELSFIASRAWADRQGVRRPSCAAVAV